MPPPATQASRASSAPVREDLNWDISQSDDVKRIQRLGALGERIRSDCRYDHLSLPGNFQGGQKVPGPGAISDNAYEDICMVNEVDPRLKFRHHVSIGDQFYSKPREVGLHVYGQSLPAVPGKNDISDVPGRGHVSAAVAYVDLAGEGGPSVLQQDSHRCPPTHPRPAVKTDLQFDTDGGRFLGLDR